MRFDLVVLISFCKYVSQSYTKKITTNLELIIIAQPYIYERLTTNLKYSITDAKVQGNQAAHWHAQLLASIQPSVGQTRAQSDHVDTLSFWH